MNEDVDSEAVIEIMDYAIKGAYEVFKARGDTNPMVAIQHVMGLCLKVGLISPHLPNPLFLQNKEEL